MGSSESKHADPLAEPKLPAVPPKLFAENRSRLVNELRKVAPKGSVVVLQGGVDQKRYNTDMEDLPFRQVNTISQINNTKDIRLEAICLQRCVAGILLLLDIWSPRERLLWSDRSGHGEDLSVPAQATGGLRNLAGKV